MRLKKNKIWILSVLLIFLVFNVFLNNYNTEEDDFKYNSNKNFNDKFSNLQLSSTFWYNSDWQYCKTINITTGSAAVPSDYTVSLTFNHASLVSVGKSRADGNDIRVVYWNGSDWEELDRMLDPGSSWDNNSTRIWFKTQATIPASSFDSNYYLYYGNALAGLPPTNSSNVFFFYDGFESGNFSAWDDIYEGGGDTINVVSSPVHNGTYAAEVYVDAGDIGQTYVQTQFNGERNFHSVVYTYIPSSWSGDEYIAHVQYYGIYEENSVQVGSITIADNREPYAQIRDPENLTYYFYMGNTPLTTDEWHRLEIKLILSSTNTSHDARVELWQDGVQTVNESGVYMPHDYISSKYIGIYWRPSNTSSEKIYIDDCFDKLWVDPEPTTTLSTEKMFRSSINDFYYYKEITIDHTKVSGSSDFINFPVLISIIDSDLHDHAQPDGDDIAFYNGSTWLDHEIELFNQNFNITHAQLVAWVRIPLLSTSTDTKIYMYYGNSTIGSQENPTGVWDNNYVGAYHLNEVPTGIANDVFDSTFYGNDGITNGSMDATNLVNSKIGMGFELDGIDDFINVSESSSLDSTNDLGTLSLWINWVNSSKTGKYQRIMTTSNRFNKVAPVHKDGFEWSVNGNGDNFFYPWGGDGLNYNLKTDPFTNGIWHYLILTFNYSNKNVTMYLDGSPVAFDIVNVDTYWTQLAELEDWLWGVSVNITQLGHFEGKYDEIRVSNITRSEDWITTEYNNQNDPNSFYSIGTEQKKLAHNTDYFNYYKEIIIDKTKVSGLSNLTNFPILISIYDKDLHNNTQSNGNDIAFYDGTNWLDHEIELFNRDYNSTHAQLISWVRIPSLSPIVDTKIYMYYGNSTIGPLENPIGVWDSNFYGVLHLNDLNPSTVEDSTINKNNGAKGNITQPSEIDAKIGKGQEFTPLYEYIQFGSIGFTNTSGTFEIWGKANTFSSTDTQYFIGHTTEPTWNNRIQIYIDDANGNLDLGIGDNHSLSTNIQDLDNNTWYHIVLTWDGANYNLYVDGVSKASGTYTGLNAFNTFVDIGNDGSITHRDEGWDGVLDEFRFSNISRSADWIATEYNNQYDPNSFYSIGPENQVGEDTSAPDIIINSPNPDDLFGWSAPNYDLTVTDANLDSIWYTLDEGFTNSTPSTAESGTIDQTLWEAQGNGTVTIRFYANDTLGNINYEEVIVRKDIVKPSINIDSPSSGSNHSTPPSYSLSITEANLDEIWYSLDGGLNNYTGAMSGTIDSIAWGTADLGAVTITFYVNDSVGNWNSTSVGVTKTSDLSISINLPHTAEWFRTIPDYDVFVSGNDRDFIWYTLDYGLTNYTITSTANLSSTWFGLINSIAWDNADQGSLTITFYLNNTFGNIVSNNVQIKKDTITPSIDSIDSPLSGSWFNSTPPNYSLSINETNLEEIWYTVNGGLNNYTGAVSGAIDSTAWSNAGQGAITIIFYVNDSAGNWNSASVQINRDTITPSIDSIDSPLSGSWFNSTPPDYSLSINETNLVEIWYSLDGGSNNYTGSESGTIDSTAWSNAGQGAITIIFYVNDSAGNWDSASVQINRDTITPSIDSIDSPLSGSWFNSTPPDYSLSINETNLEEIWYSLDGGSNNYTGSESGTIDSTAWSNAGQGAITIIFYVNDSAGNWDSASVQINRDTITPSIDSIDSPLSGSWFNSTPPNYSLSINETNLEEIWYTVNGGLNNYTGAESGAIDSTAWSNAGQGAITIIFYVNDSAGNWNSASVQINRDTIAPTIIITEPNNYDLFGITPPDITIDINDPNLDERWYQLDNGTVITDNYTWTGLIAQSVWDQVGNGTVTIRFYANDTVGNLGTEEVIVYKDIYLPIITINSPNYNDVFNSTAPSFIVAVSGSNLDARWYTLDGGSVNYTFTGLSGIINPSAWGFQEDGPITIIFYINNSLGIIRFDEITIIKDTLAPQITINLPLNNTYCGTAPIINIFATDPNLDAIWYRVNTIDILLGNNINQQLDASIWSSLPEGEFYIYIYANDSVCHVNDSIMLILYKDTIRPPAPELLNPPQGEVNLPIIFNWTEGNDPSGIVKYRLIIDTEPNNPFTIPGFVFEVNVTGNYYEYSGTLQPGTYYFFLYQIDGAGNQSPASGGSFSIGSSSQPSEPSEFPIWIIIVIIGAAIGGVVGFVVLKKAKSKEVKSVQISQKKPVPKPKLEFREELKLMDYEVLKKKAHGELNDRERKLLDYIKYLEENNDYTKAAEFAGELIIIEEILANPNKVELYRQKQIDIAIKGLDYLKDQYEIESKKAAISGDYSKSLELYKESKLISDNLKIYVEGQKSSHPEESTIIELKEPQVLMGEVEVVYSCINDLLTKFFDEIGIKYYSNPQIYDNIQNQIHGLILTDNELLIADIDPSIRDKIKSIQIIFTENLSNENIVRLYQAFHNPYILLFIVGIKWPKNIESQIIEIPENVLVEYPENTKVVHYNLFATLIGLKGAYKTAFEEIIELYNISEIDILREIHESSEIIIHSTDELRYDLKEKGLITDKLEDYFNE